MIPKIIVVAPTTAVPIKTGLAVAYGKVNYGLKEIQDALLARNNLGRGGNLEKEVIHADHMAVIKTQDL